MGFGKQLGRSLTKVVDLVLNSPLLVRIFDCLQVHRTFIGEVVKYIVGLNRSLDGFGKKVKKGIRINKIK